MGFLSFLEDFIDTAKAQGGRSAKSVVNKHGGKMNDDQRSKADAIISAGNSSERKLKDKK